MALSKIDPAGLDIGQIGGRRNLIINGAMQVWQRGTSHSNTTSNTYYADRWKHQNRQGSQTDIALVENQEVVGEIMNSYKITFDTAPTDTNFLINQYIENGCFLVAGKTITISWYAKQTTGSGVTTSTNIEIDGGATFAGTGSDNSLTSSWQRFTQTFDVSSVSVGDITSGTLRHQIFFKGTSASDVVEVTGVQLEVGDTATPFEHRSYGEELALCQRYYQKNSALSLQVSANMAYAAGNYMMAGSHLPSVMRATPTIDDSGITWSRLNANEPTPVAGSSSTIYIHGQTSGSGNSYIYGTGTYEADAEL